MSYVIVQDLPASWERYKLIAAGLFKPAPAGLIAYAAGRTDEGVRIVGIWEDEASWRRFDAAWNANAGSDLPGLSIPTPVQRDLHTEHLIVPRT